VFVRGVDGALYTRWFDAASGQWQGWANLGGSMTGTPAVAQYGANLDVFVRGVDGALYTRWFDAASGQWQGWANLGGLIGQADS
jgi:hypothetical protein